MPTASLDSLIVSPVDFERYNGHHRLHTFELPRSPNDYSTTPIDPQCTAQDVAQWLSQPGTKADPDDATMKILLIQTRNQSTAKKTPSLSSPSPALLREPPRPRTSERESQAEFVCDVFNGIGLPLAAFGAYIKAHIAFVCVPPASTSIHEDPSTMPVSAVASAKYYCSGTSWTIAWSYSVSQNHTAAVMFHREGDGDERKAEVLADLLRLQTHLSHPMLLGYIKTKISLSFTFDMLDDMNRETLALEQEIGFPTWNWVLDRVMPGQGVGETQDNAVEGFNVLSGKLTNIRFRLRTFQQQIKFISRCNAKHRHALNTRAETASGGGTGRGYEAALRECDELDAFMDVMWDYTFVHLFDADSLGERLANAMSAVFQLTTQRDSRASLAIADINNELAWQGKTTNTSMQTIAFVSLLFLPGTFVASFFDTPIFNFPTPQNGRQVVVPQPFWIYWTVSGVLTLALGVGWMSYLRRRREMDLREREGERRQFRERIRRRTHGEAAAVVLEGRDPRSGIADSVEKGYGRNCGFNWGLDSAGSFRKTPSLTRGSGLRDDKRHGKWRVKNDLYSIAVREPTGSSANVGEAGRYANSGYGDSGWPTARSAAAACLHGL
ncbi:uncharacterized protein Z518_01900 [Rhinocladiella mackenziei CBS 650.93]|uniref:Uncharacterized protein n=1 Tax=Rhinocladiella mackenziei CBS 650.93 TaxID=1442369 RepID=A0A0D2FY70_9EURO|nr:uncharacterized protein Z518_01900 [Rhinocladiella mackenziei CBS 650.93]KIX07247.1 hypothetical protein Z518_01900 [Rhinocladiella mackenziei CBS 650.93]